MLTPAPLPRRRDFRLLSGGENPDPGRLADAWRRDGEAAFWFSRAAWAMQAMVLWWEKTQGRRAPVFWLPDYFCNQSTDPVRQGSARLVFYPIGEDLEPQWQRLEELAQARPPDLFMLVHYFGRPADAVRARSFCNRHGALLVEDAAHVLRPVGDVGRYGDLVFYSPHKLLAVPDGALLLMNDPAGAAAMKEVAAGLGLDHPSPWAWAVKRNLQRILPAGLLSTIARRRMLAFGADPAYHTLPGTPSPSPFALKLLATADLAETQTLRRRNAMALEEAVRDWPGTGTLPLPEDGAPYRFVLGCETQSRAESLFSALRQRGCPVESWPDLPPEIPAHGGDHQTALGLRRTLLLLPVHQTASVEELLASLPDGSAI